MARYRSLLRCRKQYKKMEWHCQVEGSSFVIKKGRLGYTIFPMANTGCGTELPVSLERIVSTVVQTMQSGKCELKWKKLPTQRKGTSITKQEQLMSCVVNELKARFKENV